MPSRITFKRTNMELSKTAHLFIYRIREKGLEIFMLNDGQSAGNWQLPQHDTEVAALDAHQEDKFIALDPVQQEDGHLARGIAVEGDWHDIPSLKSLLKEDVVFVRDTILQVGSDVMDKGAFVALKEAIKRVAPHQYEMLKELKDIITDRNSVKHL
jgi:hypothetical protein